MNNTQRTSNVTDRDDIDAVLAEVRTKRTIARQYRKPFRNRMSKLECHRTVIFSMRARGASLQDIVVSLRSILSPRVNCSASTVKRFLDAG